MFVTTGAAFIDANYRALPPIVLGIWLGAPIAFTRHRPLLNWATLLMAMAVYPFAVSSVMLQDVPGVIDQEIAPLSWPPTVLIGYSLVQYSVAVGHRRLVAVATWLCALAVGTLSVHLKEFGAGTPDIPLLVTLGLVALVAGDNVRGRRETRARLQAEEQRSEVLRTKRALLEERARIARELHDIVAHHMSVIAVQASTAAYRVPGLRPEAETEFDSIADTARASMTELRRLLAVLRSEDEGLRSGQVAVAAGVNRQTLRYYERRGLILEPDRTLGGHRMYPPETVQLLRVIKAAQRLGFTLDEVADLLAVGAPRHGRRGTDSGLLSRAEGKLAEVEAKIAGLGIIRDTLQAAIAAGCDDLMACAQTPCCPLPFSDLASDGRTGSALKLHATAGEPAGH